MNTDTSKRYQVVNKETEISVKFFETEAEAKDYAEWMTDYHGEQFEIRKDNKMSQKTLPHVTVVKLDKGWQIWMPDLTPYGKVLKDTLREFSDVEGIAEWVIEVMKPSAPQFELGLVEMPGSRQFVVTHQAGVLVSVLR